jgi:hypothetical protein
MKRNYLLAIDGPLFRRQRILLLQASEAARRKTPFFIREASDRELLEGLVAMLDEIACLLDAKTEGKETLSENGRCDSK